MAICVRLGRPPTHAGLSLVAWHAMREGRECRKKRLSLRRDALMEVYLARKSSLGCCWSPRLLILQEEPALLAPAQYGGGAGLSQRPLNPGPSLVVVAVPAASAN